MKEKISNILKKVKLPKIAGVLAHFDIDDPEAEPTALCALGALYHGKVFSNKQEYDKVEDNAAIAILKENFDIPPDRLRKLFYCPSCNQAEFGLDAFLIHLNDKHDVTSMDGLEPLSFPQIAEILEKQGL